MFYRVRAYSFSQCFVQSLGRFLKERSIIIARTIPDIANQYKFISRIGNKQSESHIESDAFSLEGGNCESNLQMLTRVLYLDVLTVAQLPECCCGEKQSLASYFSVYKVHALSRLSNQKRKNLI